MTKVSGGQIHVCACALTLAPYPTASDNTICVLIHIPLVQYKSSKIGLRPEISSRTVSHEREDDPDPVHFPPVVERRRVSIALRTALHNYS